MKLCLRLCWSSNRSMKMSWNYLLCHKLRTPTSRFKINNTECHFFSLLLNFLPLLRRSFSSSVYSLSTNYAIGFWSREMPPCIDIQHYIAFLMQLTWISWFFRGEKHLIAAMQHFMSINRCLLVKSHFSPRLMNSWRSTLCQKNVCYLGVIDKSKHVVNKLTNLLSVLTKPPSLFSFCLNSK